MPTDSEAYWRGAGKGAASGMGIGASIGTAIAPGIGTAIGAGIGGIIGFFGGGSGAKKVNEGVNKALGDINEIAPTDPMMTGFLDELRREKRMVETGMTPEFSVARDLIRQAEAGASNVATRFNNPATALYFLNTINRGAGANVNKLLGTISSQKGGYMQAIGKMVGDISQRKLDVDVYKKTQGLAVATQNYSDVVANQNMMMMMGINAMGGAMTDLKDWNPGRDTALGVPMNPSDMPVRPGPTFTPPVSTPSSGPQSAPAVTAPSAPAASTGPQK